MKAINYPEKVVKKILKGPIATKASDLVGPDKKGMDYDNIHEIMEEGHRK